MDKTIFTSFKTLLLIILIISFYSNQVVAQNNNGVFFQAVARDNFSNPAKDRKIYVQSSIVQTTPTGTKVLTEEHQANTDASGVFSISIGNGVRVGGTASSLTTIDWSKGPFYLNLKVAITPIGGNSSWDYNKEWVDMGTTSFGAVPFALYAANAGGLDQKLSITDTTRMLAPYSKMVNALVASNITSLTAATVNAALNSKVNLVDSGLLYITPTMLAAKTFDQTPITSAITKKLNIADSTNGYVTPTQLAAKTFDTTSLSNRINLKATNVDLINLTTNVNSNTASITANTNSINSNTASITANTTAIGLKLDANKVGVANGVASLNLNGLIPNNQIPAISFQSATVVTGEPAMLALNNAVVGSIAIRTDNSKNFVLSALPASTIGNWIELVSPASVTSVNGNAGPTVNLAASDIPGVEALVNKSTATNLGSTNPSDILYPTQKAVKTYVDAQTAAAGVLDGTITNAKLAGSITAGKLVGTDISIVGTIATGVWSATTIGLTKGGTGATNAADARTNLGLVIGTNVQAPLTAGTDYLTPTGSAANLTNFPTLNQNTTGNAATATLATTATTAGNITATSNTTLTSLSNLNTVGTITSGTWSATTIDIAHGGTGSTTKNFVDLSTNQNAIGGTKTFSNNIVSNGVSIGKGSGVTTSSIIIGPWTNAGENSIAIGSGTMTGNGGAFNIAIGENALRDSGPVSKNTAVGFNAGSSATVGDNNTYLGYATIPNSGATISNSTAIGSGAKIYASNTIRLGANGLDGTTAIDSVITTGTLTAGAVTYPKTHGTANQVLSTTGSGTLTWTTVSTTADAATLSGTIAINNGGTGASSKSAAFNALSPMTTSGDIIYGGLNGTGTRLGKGNNFSFLTLDDVGLPTWTNAIRATSGSTYNAAVGFSFIGGDWAKNTGMFSDNPDDGTAMLKFRITGNSKLTIDPNNVTVLANTASTSKTTGSLIVSGGLGVSGDIYASNLNVSGAITGGTWSATTIAIANGGTGATNAAAALTNLGAAPINANLNDQTGTTYTLLSSDNGKVVTLENGSAITLTVPAGLSAGFNCMIVQKGLGVVTITPANTVTVTNRSGGTKTGGQNAIVSLIALTATYFISGGDMQ